MKELNRDELELIFDYCLGTADVDQMDKARQLIDSNPEAADFCSKVQASIGPLDQWAVEPCPDDLVEKTISYVNEAVQSGQEKLGELLAVEEARTQGSHSTLWINLGRRLAMAAAFMIVGSIVLSTMRYMRYQSWQAQCEAQLAGIGQGISSYSADYDGKLPAVAMSAGSPWWKVGYQGQENVSNTRHIWLLVKGGYTGPNDFVCPGANRGELAPISAEQASSLPDFPSRKYISYSLRLICEQLPTDFGRPLKLQLDDRLLNQNSNNHQRKGQNVLFSDSSVQFVKTRRVGINNDDMFTLRGTRFYEGCEMPTCDTDDFMAP